MSGWSYSGLGSLVVDTQIQQQEQQESQTAECEDSDNEDSLSANMTKMPIYNFDMHVLRLNFNSKLHKILIPIGATYADIILAAIEKFNIAHSLWRGLYITDEQGYLIEAKVFESYLQLHPQPKIIFHLYLNYRILPMRTVQRLGVKYLMDLARIKQQSPASQLCEATPVFRQNCFIGALPSISGETSVEQKEQRTGKRKQPAEDITTIATLPKRLRI